MTKGISAVLFDFGGTLDADGATWLERFYPLYKEEGLVGDKETFAKAFYRSDDTLAERFPLKGLSLEKTLELQVGLVLEQLAPSRKSLTAKIAGRFLQDCRLYFRRNVPVLERLAKRCKLGIVSNFYGNLDGILASEGLSRFFGAVADSAVVGTLKPEPGIFLHALAELDSSVDAAAMVGDSIPRDMRGAEALGMAHVLISRSGKPCCAKAKTAPSFIDIEPLLLGEPAAR